MTNKVNYIIHFCLSKWYYIVYSIKTIHFIEKVIWKRFSCKISCAKIRSYLFGITKINCLFCEFSVSKQSVDWIIFRESFFCIKSDLFLSKIVFIYHKKMHTAGAEVSGFISILIVQVTILIIFGIFVRYDHEMLPKNENATSEEILSIEQKHRVSYPRKCFCFVKKNKIHYWFSRVLYPLTCRFY